MDAKEIMELPPFPYNKDSYEFEEFVSFAQQEANYQFYYSNFSALENISIEDLDFSVRLYNIIKRSGHNVLGEILFLPLSYFFALKNFGKNCMHELIEKLSIQVLSNIVNTVDDIVNVIPPKETNYYDKQLGRREMSVRAYNVLLENNLLNEFVFLSMSDESIKRLKQVGGKTSEELIFLKKSKLLTSKEFFVNKVNEKLKHICNENFVFDLKLLSGERLSNLLLEIGIQSVVNLRDINKELIPHLWVMRNEVYSLITLLSRNLFKTIEEQFEWCLSCNMSGKKREKDAERNIEILTNRAKGLRLLSAGEKYHLTRERVRQIELKKIRTFDKFLHKNATIAFLSFLSRGKSCLAAREIEESIIYGDIFAYFLKKSDAEGIIYVQELDAFIFGKNWFIWIEQFIEQLPPTITRTDFKNEVNQLYSELCRQGIVFNQNDIENIILSKYMTNGEFLTRSKLTLLAKYKMVLERYFQDGINIYDELELKRFRNSYNEIYDDNEISDNNRALIGRIVDNCILIGRGRYALKRSSYISDDLLKEIYNFIFCNHHDIIMANTIFHKFEKRLSDEGVDNKYFLQGILKQHNIYGLFITRDYISKSKEKSNIYNDVLNFIKSKQDIVNIVEIKKEFPAIPDSVLSMVFGEEIISIWNKNYIHRDNIEFDEQDEFFDFLKELVEREKLVSDNKIFTLSKKRFADFIVNNHIDTPFFLYSILKSFFSEKFRFNRPYIIDASLDIVKGVDLIRQQFAGRESFKVSEVKDFAREKDITIYSFIDLINSLEEFLWADKETLMNSSKIIIEESTLSKIEQAVASALGKNDYAEISKLNLINSLPPVGNKWTNWLIYSIIYRYSTNFEVTTSSNFYNLAVPIIMKNDVSVDFVRERIEERHTTDAEYKIDDLSDIDKLIEGLITEKDI